MLWWCGGAKLFFSCFDVIGLDPRPGSLFCIKQLSCNGATRFLEGRLVDIASKELSNGAEREYWGQMIVFVDRGELLYALRFDTCGSRCGYLMQVFATNQWPWRNRQRLCGG